ncbi:MAG: hypothetical protein ABI446_05140 [Gemmatimonadaceae bacterium]
MNHVMSSSLRISIGLLLAIASATACRSAGASAASGNERTTTTIDIQNNDFNDMTIYAVTNGQRVRLGIAPGNKTTVLTIPRYILNGTTYLRFLANPLAGNRSPVSEEIDVSTGDQLVMIINSGG